MKNLKTLMAALAAALLMFGCELEEDDPEPVAPNSLEITNVVERNTSSDINPDAPVLYDVTVEWSKSNIMADDTASGALTGFRAYLYGSSIEIEEDLDSDANSYTFSGLLPGDSCSLMIYAVYEEGTYDVLQEEDSISFTGGPWFEAYNSTSSSIPKSLYFSVGSFNQIDAIPTGSFTVSDAYYYNEYNSEYHFTAVGEVIWMIVGVHAVTDSNDTDTQRNNVMWLNNDFQLFDADSSRLTDTTDIASVSVDIVDVYGDTLASISGTQESATITDFNSFLNSVEPSSYVDEDGIFYLKATCTAMPSVYSDDNEDAVGYWGFGIPGPRRY